MMDYRQQRQYYRAQRRAYRRQMRGPFGGLGGLIMLIVILSILGNHLFWVALPFLCVVFCILLARGLFGAAMSNQQQYRQPYQQDQTIYTYQQPQEDPPAYEPYTQGYTPQQPTQPARIYQESEPQSDQYAEQQQQTQQYEEPLTMYPQE